MSKTELLLVTPRQQELQELKIRQLCRKRNQELLVEQANFCKTFRKHTHGFTEAELIGLEISHFIDTLERDFNCLFLHPFPIKVVIV